MNVEFRLPTLDNTLTAEQKIETLQSYLYQMVQKLNWAFSMIDKENTENISETQADVLQLKKTIEDNINVTEEDTSTKNVVFKTVTVKDAGGQTMEIDSKNLTHRTRNGTARTVFENHWYDGEMYFGTSSDEIILRGSAPRPKYNESDLALKSDIFGNSSEELKLLGSTTRPKYNGNELALKSDVSGGGGGDYSITDKSTEMFDDTFPGVFYEVNGSDSATVAIPTKQWVQSYIAYWMS